jgi:hypothetical protein
VNESSDVLYTIIGSNVTCVVKNFRDTHFQFLSLKVDVGLCVCVDKNEVCSQDIVYDLKHLLLNICYLVYMLCYLSCRENTYKVSFFRMLKE